MNKSIVIEEMKPGDEFPISELVKMVFDIYVAPDFSEVGLKEFLGYIKPSL